MTSALEVAPSLEGFLGISAEARVEFRSRRRNASRPCRVTTPGGVGRALGRACRNAGVWTRAIRFEMPPLSAKRRRIGWQCGNSGEELTCTS